MKIISLNVQSFGKLKNVRLDFNDGVNVIQNVNGFGKTTMASFIRAMLYGLSSRTVGGTSDLKRFAPWGENGRFGGSIVLEQDGETYRVERFFGSTPRQETLTVVNVKTNKPVTLLPTVGEALLGLTADSFDRSAYYPQEAVELSANDNLEQRLANLVENGAEDYDKVQKNIRDYRRNLKLERGSGGEIYRLECRARELQTELSAAQNADRRNSAIERRLAEISAKQRELKRRQTEDNRRLDELRRKLAKAAPTEAEAETAAKARDLQAKLSRIPSEIEADRAELDGLAEKIRNVRDDVRPKIYPNARVLTVSVIFAVLGLAALVVGAVLPQIVCIIAGAAALVAGVVGVIVAFKRKGAVTLPAGERDAYVSQYFAVCSKYFYVNDLDCNQAIKRFDEFYRDYIGDRRELDALKSTIKPAADISALEADIRSLENAVSSEGSAITALASEQGRLEEERKHLSFDCITPQENLTAVREEIAAANARYETAGIVAELLEQAKDNLSSSYLPRLCERCQQLLRRIMLNGCEVVIDREFNVKVRENGQTKNMSEFSRGTREIILLCFRIALSELLYDGAVPFVIVDDAFVNYDEANFLRATDVLRELSNNGQVIYFTCHNRLGNLLK